MIEFSFIPEIKIEYLANANKPYLSPYKNTVLIPSSQEEAFSLVDYLEADHFKVLKKIYVRYMIWFLHRKIILPETVEFVDKERAGRDDLRFVRYEFKDRETTTWCCLYPFVIFFTGQGDNVLPISAAVAEFNMRFPLHGTSKPLLQIPTARRETLELATMVTHCILPISHPYLRSKSRFHRIVEGDDVFDGTPRPHLVLRPDTTQGNIEALCYLVALFIPGVEGIDDFHTDRHLLKQIQALIFFNFDAKADLSFTPKNLFDIFVSHTEPVSLTKSGRPRNHAFRLLYPRIQKTIRIYQSIK